jgi:hypothetical protein
MTPAAAAILDGMPEPKDLRRVTSAGITWIFAGPVALFSYPEADAGMRNIAVAVLRQLGYPGQPVAGLMGLSECYVATLRNRTLREGTAGVVRPRGRRRKLGEAAWEQARAWRAAGVPDAQIADGSACTSPPCCAALVPAMPRLSCRSPTRPRGRHQAQGTRPRLGRTRSLPGNPGLPLLRAQSRGLHRSRSRDPPETGRTCRCPATRVAGARAGRLPGPRRGRGSPRARSPPGMRARCYCTPSATGPMPGRCWPPQPAPGRHRTRRGVGSVTWRCCRRPASASRWAPPPSSSSST